MEHPDEFIKLLRQIMSQEPKPTSSKEEVHLDVLSIKVIEMVGEKYVVWLN
ncbi:MAG: hypothetical protein KAS29_02480 [Bacteroidales bacterium]|nr:hypothetical protein [Bacteroidales bacterium]